MEPITNKELVLRRQQQRERDVRELVDAGRRILREYQRLRNALVNFEDK